MQSPTIADTRSWNVAMGAIGVGLFLWAMWYARPYGLLIGILIATPLIMLAAVAVTGGFFQLMIDDSNDSDQPEAMILIFLPILTLAARMAADFALVDATSALVVAGGFAALFSGILWWVRRRFVVELLPSEIGRPRPAIFITLSVLILPPLLGYAYGYSIAVAANTLGDDAVATTYPVEVTGKHISKGKYTHYELALAPWRLKPQGDVQEVPEAVYSAISLGQQVCIDVHAGRFGWRWTRLAPCSQPDTSLQLASPVDPNDEPADERSE